MKQKSYLFFYWIKIVAHLSQIQQQLQIDPQNSSLNKSTYPQSVSIQQQLQTLSQMVELRIWSVWIIKSFF